MIQNVAQACRFILSLNDKPDAVRITDNGDYKSVTYNGDLIIRVRRSYVEFLGFLSIEDRVQNSNNIARCCFIADRTTHYMHFPCKTADLRKEILKAFALSTAKERINDILRRLK